MPTLPARRYMPPPMRGGSIADLLMQRGAIAARGAERSGQIWGGAVAGLGELAGQTISRYGEQKATEDAVAQEEREREQRTAAFQEILGDQRVFEDGQYAFTRLSELYEPPQALPLAQAFQTFGQAQGETDPNKAMGHVPALAAGFVAAGEDVQPLLRGPLQSWLTNAGLVPEGGWENVSPEQFLSVAQSYAPPAEEPEPKAEWQLVPGDPTQERHKITGDVRPSQVVPKPPAPRAIRFLPRQVSSGGKDIMANYDPQSGRFHHPDTGKVLEDVAPMGGATQRNRKAAAETSVKSGERLITELEDDVGPILGRWNNLLAAAGFGDPKAQYLVGSIRSFAALQPQIHGFRAYKMAAEIEALLSTAQTPEALTAALRGVLTASYYVAGGEPPVPDFEQGERTEAEAKEHAGVAAGMSPDEYDAFMEGL